MISPLLHQFILVFRKDEAKAGVDTCDTTGVRVEVLFLLEAAAPASSLFPMGKRFLQELRRGKVPTIAMAEQNFKYIARSLLVLFPNMLADLLGVKLLK